MDKEQYLAFHQGLLDGEKTEFKEWEKDTPYFEGCMPIEVMADARRRYAALRADEAGRARQSARPGAGPMRSSSCGRTMRSARLWNMVGFQTKLKHAEQVRLFRTIPGLEKAEFARLGGLHRNTFIHSPELLDADAAAEERAAYPLRRADHRLRRLCRNRRRSGCSRAASPRPSWPATTLDTAAADDRLGRAARRTSPAARRPTTYQPMNVNFGLFPPIEGRTKKADRKLLYTARARDALEAWQTGLAPQDA